MLAYSFIAALVGSVCSKLLPKQFCAPRIPTMNNMPAQQEQETTAESGVILQLVTFQLMGEVFGLPILSVREIIRLTDITPVPQAPPFLEGVINLRGQILPVVDLRKRFGLSGNEHTSDTRVVIAEVGKHSIGLVVDSVSQVSRVPESTVAPPPPLVAGGIGAEYIKGIAHHNDQMLILVDLDRVFNQNELESLSSM